MSTGARTLSYEVLTVPADDPRHLPNTDADVSDGEEVDRQELKNGGAVICCECSAGLGREQRGQLGLVAPLAHFVSEACEPA